MRPETFSLVLDQEIAADTYFEGMLLHPTDPSDGIAVLRKNDDDLTLVIYKILFHPPSKYQTEYHLLTKSFPTEKAVQKFLETFSTLTGEEFWAFIHKLTD
ncbi:hypothetical protein BN1058_00503 [Paraliobacillus sp. PM-2]|uniref:hypothetical protein n=1 Tax=Paraliobacillus sp. PM-2 TaxID=1462524 RepID=UPI00061C2E09|nr:hypothetical protein [Paraliobacillus sp. PM-2]CQR46250.1 hypothetical protein BN1058_00503 [Paraliobacillus sp. PM-2]